MNKYNEILGKDYERIIFGYKSVEMAVERKAIDILIVSDDYLRKVNPNSRKELVKNKNNEYSNHKHFIHG